MDLRLTGHSAWTQRTLSASLALILALYNFFPEQVQYYPGQLTKFYVNATVHGDQWVRQHGDTAVALGKPEVVTAIGVVTKETFHDFVPFNSSKRMPPGVPCRGVDDNQKEYAFTSWSAVMLSTCGKVGGFLEYQFFTEELLDVPRVNRKRQNPSSKDGYKGSGHPKGQYVK